MINEPKKYIFIVSPPGDIVRIVEIGPISYSGFNEDGQPTVFEFISQEKFQDVILFHQATENHCPMLQQCWLSQYIDLWEDTSDFIIYDTEEEAKKAGDIFREY